MAKWSVDGDSLSCGTLRLAIQRIGVTHWQLNGKLRSWGVAPLHLEGECLYVPCADDEALWIGAWLEPRLGGGTVSLADYDLGGLTVRIDLSAASRITALGNGAPVARLLGKAARSLQLTLTHDRAAPVCIEMVLIQPLDWMARSSRHVPTLDGPPPLPPRLG